MITSALKTPDCNKDTGTLGIKFSIDGNNYQEQIGIN